MLKWGFMGFCVGFSRSLWCSTEDFVGFSSQEGGILIRISGTFDRV